MIPYRKGINMNLPYEIKKVQNTHFSIQLYYDYFNKRLRIDHYRGNMTKILAELNRILTDHDAFTKVIWYTRPEHWMQLLSKGFELEAVITGYFNGSDNYVMTTYKETNRRVSKLWVKEDMILESLYSKTNTYETGEDRPEYSFRKAEQHDAIRLAELYGKVFEIYPTPMNKPEYVKKMLQEGNIFYLTEFKDTLVSAASADCNYQFNHAELTDCATLPNHRKYGLIKKLLLLLEKDLMENGIYCAFSLARALSYGMNAAFYQLGYKYNGRLTNNCYIYDKLEDMNVWVKDLSR